jgi:hypothetical protein
MKIGIISDSHDNRENILKAIEILNAEKVEKVFHAGDIVNAESADLFRMLDAEIVVTFGNCDFDRDNLKLSLSEKADFYDDFYEGIVADKKIFMSHRPYDEIFYLKKKYDLVIHGHTHRLECKNLGDSILVNPGEIVGRKTGRATISIFDLKNLKNSIIDLN